jgi:hypothetical protein
MLKRLTAVLAAMIATAALTTGPATALPARPADDAPPVACQPYLDDLQATIDDQKKQLDRDIRIILGYWWDQRRLEGTVDRLGADLADRDATITGQQKTIDRQQRLIKRLRHRLARR